MFLLFASNVEQPSYPLPTYSFGICKVVDEPERENWLQFANRERKLFKDWHFQEDNGWGKFCEGIETFCGCLEQVKLVDMYVGWLCQDLPVGYSGPPELKIIMGGFTKPGCPIAFHMGLSKTFRAFECRRKEKLPSDVLPLSMQMHKFMAQALLIENTQIIYTCSLPVERMIEIMFLHIPRQFIWIGYREQLNDGEFFEAFYRDFFSKVQEKQITNFDVRMKATLDLTMRLIYRYWKNDGVLSVEFERVNGMPEEFPKNITFTAPNGQSISILPDQNPWCFEKPFYPSQCVFGFPYVTILTEGLVQLPLSKGMGSSILPGAPVFIHRT